MTLKRLFVVIACFFMAESGFAQDTTKLAQLSAHVYAYTGITQASPSGNSFGANCGVIVGDHAVLVVDTLISAKKAREFISQIKEITGKPIKYAVNTHHHLDHAWGNSEFEKLGAIIIGHANTPLSKAQVDFAIAHAQGYGLTTDDLAGTQACVPSVTFNDTMNIDLGNVTVTLHFPGASHTNSSITAYVNEDHVLFAGDIVFNKYHPFLAEGDIANWINVLSGLETSTASIIVPGHGPVATKKDLKELAVYLKAFDSTAKKLCQQKTQEEAPAISEELLRLLPDQGRTELTGLVEMNIRGKYLPIKKD